ncbi:phenylphosphate carboxylase subunit delta [bacterium]|nr:MAG: phenylphosphate carboxylase subunit delta [bacterium]
MSSSLKKDLNPETAAKNVKLIAFDVDGVLTDGRIFYTSSGEEIKSFNVRDGHAIKLAIRAGVEISLITGRTSHMVKLRAEELGIEHFYQGAKDKIPVLETLLAKLDLDPSQVAYLGDDVVDLPVILRVGLGCAVADAPEEVKERADVVMDSRGGEGAARDLIVFILKAQGLWDGLMEKYVSN